MQMHYHFSRKYFIVYCNLNTFINYIIELHSTVYSTAYQYELSKNNLSNSHHMCRVPIDSKHIYCIFFFFSSYYNIMRSLRCLVHLKQILISFKFITQYIFENVLVNEIVITVKQSSIKKKKSDFYDTTYFFPE